ncbi:MAG: hypothetical protein HA496_00810 [Thaumarchaeota archaeon]|nr:hypothetical protein [Nitrososphaerota archaeon]
MIETKISPQDTETISDLSRIFAPYGITISASDNNLTLQSTLMISQKLLEEERYWLEENAPEKTITHLRQAHEKLGRGEWAETLSACRNALESLTKSGSFTGFINELVEKEIIAKGEEQRMKDAELLKTIYGFCSTIGSHAAGQVLANEQRARMGLLITEAAIYFLCRQMEEARSKGICR